MTSQSVDKITTIPLERPASVRKHLPSLDDGGWLLPGFVVGPENEQLRYLFLPATIERLAELSPIVLYGDGGVGKTALAITLAVTWSRAMAKRPLCFTTGKSFSQDFSAAVEIDDTVSFRKRHRNCQLLVIDDFATLASASAAQVELVHTLDELSATGRPLVVTSQRLPASIAALSPALSSRLAGGFSTEISRPVGETAIELVRALALSIDKHMDLDAVLEVARKFDRQQLSPADWKIIVLLAHQSKGSNGEIDTELVSALARQHFDNDMPTIAGIAKAVAKRMRVRLTEMRGATREANIVRARGLAIHLARSLTGTSLQQIGQFFGGRDHSTVLHAFRKTEKMLDTDTELAILLRDIHSDLNVKR